MTPAILFFVLAVVLIAIELLIMQFSVFWLMFFGLGALLTAIICFIMPGITMSGAASIFLVSSLGVAVLLYPILRKWQSKAGPIAGNDAIGQTAKVIAKITAEENGKVSWSGSEWPAQLAQGSEPLEVGESVTIQKLEGIRLIVRR